MLAKFENIFKRNGAHLYIRDLYIMSRAMRLMRQQHYLVLNMFKKVFLGVSVDNYCKRLYNIVVYAKGVYKKIMGE